MLRTTSSIVVVAGQRRVQPGLEHRHHAGRDRRALDLGVVGAGEDQPLDRGVRARGTRRSPAGRGSRCCGIAGSRPGATADRPCGRGGPARTARPAPAPPRGPPAVRAQPPHQPLRQHAAQHRGHQVVLQPHVAQPGDGGGGRVGVHRGQHQMPGQRRLHRDLRGLQVADLADHDDVRVLPQDRAQQGGEVQPDLRLDLDLVDARELVLDRVLDRDDLARDRVERQQPGIQRRGLAAAGRPGDQHDAVRQVERRVEPGDHRRRQAERA